MAANFINLTDSIEQWRVKANAVYGTVGDLTTLVSDGTVNYTAVIGQNSDDFTGTPAQFTVTREFGGYTIAITAGLTNIRSIDFSMLFSPQKPL